MRSSIVAVAMAAACALAPAWAGVRVGGGIAEEHGGEEAPVATLAWLGEQRHPWEVMVGHIGRREDARIEESWFFALSKRLTWNRWFVSGGLAWANVDNDILSGHTQFMTAGGYDFGRVALSLRHMSNAGIEGRNRGETFLLVEVGF
ncbi:acyloxyacyl hydrolase [Vulcaniibacterium tengchongense]|uniref:Lipid A 3-O-deacylase PagL n=1 Tax=Vulcaniibacterium tengchongense TaxID=1273429 RepID=A0A3N4VJA1_9GAMM|nr:acyloxyacyl hydrolase [Vulcaniibacterium tengchongense]RPE79799.1 lipid A 3-O-deacylase PagL [Vulcaniibacterium tengchongense]